MLLSRPDFMPLTNRDYLGFGLWTVGFTLEVVADFQKSVFCNMPENKVCFISEYLYYMNVAIGNSLKLN